MNFFKSALPCLAFVFAVATGCESKADKDRKPQLVENLVKRSIETCDTGTYVAGAMPYADRLRKVLMECNSSSLDVFIKHDIAIVLDQRLSTQENNFFVDRRMDAVFYNRGDSLASVSLWDDGTDGDGILNMSPSNHNADALNKLASHIVDNDINAETKVAIASQYSTGGKYATYSTGWKSAADFNSSTTKKNDVLLKQSRRIKTHARKNTLGNGDW